MTRPRNVKSNRFPSKSPARNARSPFAANSRPLFTSRELFSPSARSVPVAKIPTLPDMADERKREAQLFHRISWGMRAGQPFRNPLEGGYTYTSRFLVHLPFSSGSSFSLRLYIPSWEVKKARQLSSLQTFKPSRASTQSQSFLADSQRGWNVIKVRLGVGGGCMGEKKFLPIVLIRVSASLGPPPPRPLLCSTVVRRRLPLFIRPTVSRSEKKTEPVTRAEASQLCNEFGCSRSSKTSLTPARYEGLLILRE